MGNWKIENCRCVKGGTKVITEKLRDVERERDQYENDIGRAGIAILIPWLQYLNHGVSKLNISCEGDNLLIQMVYHEPVVSLIK